MSENEESESLVKDRPMDKSGRVSGSAEDGAGATDRDRDRDNPSMGSGAPGPLPAAFVDGGGRWYINDEKEPVVAPADEDGVQVEFLENEGPNDEEYASAVEGADERTVGRLSRDYGVEAAADLRRVVAYIGIGISVGSESGISTPVLHYHEHDQLHTAGIAASGSLVPVPVLVRDEYGEDGTLRVRDVSRH